MVEGDLVDKSEFSDEEIAWVLSGFNGRIARESEAKMQGGCAICSEQAEIKGTKQRKLADRIWQIIEDLTSF